MVRAARAGVIATLTLLATSLAADSSKPRPKLTPALAEMLGMADEYMSRFNYWTGKPHNHLGESFYPAEGKLADAYEALIKAHAKESGASLPYRRKVGGQGHIAFGSAELADLINAFYVPASAGSKIYTLDSKLILGASAELRLRYLKGAHARYGGGSNVIRMANASLKVETIGRVLKSLGCTGVALYMMDAIPMGHYVRFEPSAAVSKVLGTQKRVSEAELVKDGAKLRSKL